MFQFSDLGPASTVRHKSDAPIHCANWAFLLLNFRLEAGKLSNKKTILSRYNFSTSLHVILISYENLLKGIALKIHKAKKKLYGIVFCDTSFVTAYSGVR